MGKRVWNDYKDRKDIVKGKFTEQEIKIIVDSLCSYIQDNNFGEDTLVGLIQLSKEQMTEEMKGAWCKISESLPNRSVQSIHNLCKRKFNPNNYQGKWSHEEEEYLKELIE